MTEFVHYEREREEEKGSEMSEDLFEADIQEDLFSSAECEDEDLFPDFNPPTKQDKELTDEKNAESKGQAG